MSKLIKTDSSYKAWITELKQRIRQSQIKAAVKVNVEMLHLYWSIGEDIIKRNAEAVWGKSVINQLFEGCITKIIKVGFAHFLKHYQKWLTSWLTLTAGCYQNIGKKKGSHFRNYL